MKRRKKNMNDQSKCNRRLSKHSAAIDSDQRRDALHRFDDGNYYIIDVCCTNNYVQQLLMQSND